MTINERNQYVIDNLKLVHYLLKPYRHQYDYEDLVQVGVEGMCKALDRMDGEINSNYLGIYITGYVRRYIDMNHTLHIPYAKVQQGVTVECLSLDYKYEDKWGENVTLQDAIQDNNCTTEDDIIAYADFDLATRCLTKKQKEIYQYLVSGLTLSEIAKIVQTSPQAVQSRTVKIRERMRRYIK